MYTYSALELHKAFMEGAIAAEAIALYFLQRTKSIDPQIQAFLSLFSERALDRARALDKKRQAGHRLGKMAAVPIAIKDNIHVEGQKTTCASKILQNYHAVFDASVVRYLETEDALILGKTNLDEFAMGSSTEHSAFFSTKNPWDLACTPGGSSGGSAAAVAARCVPLALGSDTGGSVRQPAAFTGVVGFKPTYGRVSRYGLVAFASSLDQIGPFATSVPDVAYILETIAAPCERDATHIHTPAPSYQQILQSPCAKKTIGVPWQFLENLSPPLQENFRNAIEIGKSIGFSIVDIDLSALRYSLAIYSILATAEASTNLARYDGIRYGLRSTRAHSLEEIYQLSKQEGFGKEVKNRILLGTFVLSSGYKDAYYTKALQAKQIVSNQIHKAFCQCDLIALPSAPSAAFPLYSIQDPVDMYLQDIYTIGANLAGLPAISIPSGTYQGKPLGLQLMGKKHEDALVLQAAYAIEKATSYHKKIPPIFDKEW